MIFAFVIVRLVQIAAITQLALHISRLLQFHFLHSVMINRGLGYLGLTLVMHWYNLSLAQDCAISAHDIGINRLLREEKVNDLL